MELGRNTSKARPEYLHQRSPGGDSLEFNAIDMDRSFNYLLLTFSSGRNSLVECQLPKLKVASSSLVARSRILDFEVEMTLAIGVNTW